MKIVIVDDHDMVRRGLISCLIQEEDMDIVGEASSGEDAVKLVEAVHPDVVLMDLIMEGMNGIQATEEILNLLPAVKVIILTSFYDDNNVFPALEAGAFSYLLKTAKAEEVIDAIRKASKNESIVEPKVAAKLLSRVRKQQPQLHDDLTERELEVLLCLAKGMTNQAISETLFIGIKTVKTHVSHILSKLHVEDRTQAAVYAHENRLVSRGSS
ncbi:response regulator [Bacillus fonticola]|uniref:response regulator n=1 Tax=Bacillus fonticola TaxID=2728853 RepID=UPI001472EB6F|nr:response regulator transcription factor [Bacillus fonticola]